MKNRNTPLFMTGLFCAIILLSILLVTVSGGKGGASDGQAQAPGGVGGNADAAFGGSAEDGALLAASAEDSETVVVTSFYPMYIAARNLLDGVEGVRLENLSEPQTGCLHDYQLVPADMELLTDADVFIVNGGGMESFLGDVTERLPGLAVIDTSETIVSEMPHLEEDHAEEADIHPEEAHAHAKDDTHVHDESAADHESDAHAEDTHVHDESAADHESDIHAEEADVHDESAADHESDAHAEDTDGHQHEHDMNAHFWLSVPLYRRQVEAMADGLCAYFSNASAEAEGAGENDAAHTDEESSSRAGDHGASDVVAQIETNRDRYFSQIDELVDAQGEMRAALSDMPVIVFHEGFFYIAGDYGMAVVGDMDLDEERQISAGEVAGVVDTVNAFKADGRMPVILAEERYGKDMAEAVKAETDVKVLYLDALVRAEDGYKASAYITRMKRNMELLRSAGRQQE